MRRRGFTLREAITWGEAAGVDWERSPFGPEELRRGMNVELEHADVTGGDPLTTARIARAHLRERPDYYELLEVVESAPARRRRR